MGRASGSATRRHWSEKGNKVLANGALSGTHDKNGPAAWRAFIYGPQRVNEADFEVVRDAGFEHVAPNWEQFQKKDPVRSNGAL